MCPKINYFYETQNIYRIIVLLCKEEKIKSINHTYFEKSIVLLIKIHRENCEKCIYLRRYWKSKEQQGFWQLLFVNMSKTWIPADTAKLYVLEQSTKITWYEKSSSHFSFFLSVNRLFWGPKWWVTMSLIFSYLYKTPEPHKASILTHFKFTWFRSMSYILTPPPLPLAPMHKLRLVHNTT